MRTPDSVRGPGRPDWANAYEAGYRQGYRHGMADARAARTGEDGPRPTLTRTGPVFDDLDPITAVGESGLVLVSVSGSAQ